MSENCTCIHTPEVDAGQTLHASYCVAAVPALPMPVGDQPQPLDDADANTVAARAAQVITSMGAEIRALRSERDRYRTAWQSARERAEAHGEGILRVVKDRESYQQWLKQAEARVAELEAERHTTNEALSDAAEQLRANRDHLARVEAKLAKYVGAEPTIAEEMEYLSRCLNAVRDLCDATEKQATRWENPLPVPEWVEQVRTATDGVRPDDPNDNRHRLYIDGKGKAWISVCSDEGTEWVVRVQPEAAVEQDVRDVADETGSLREIGRCW